jgi:UDP-N-acetylmuramoyl-L-alanyl-D-glutamate--2,6-diaminopimelate ligase
LLLSELINGDRAGAAADLEIRGLAADSREVRPGYLFAAIPGSRAVAVLAPPGAALAEAAVPMLTDDNPRRRLALMAARFYRRQPRTVAAVTGTNGKTSVAEFTRQMWSHLGLQAASLGTLGVRGATISGEVPHTTPEPVNLHRILQELADQGVDHAAIEASSHGLDQCRLDGVRVSAAAFTNVSRDHLDYHQSADAYFNAKLRLFDQVMAPGGAAVLNADADDFQLLREVCEGRGHRIFSYGAKGTDLRLVGREPRENGQALVLEIAGGEHRFEVPLVGAFQAWNLLCALGLISVCGGDLCTALEALDKLEGVPGRMQLVVRHPNGAPVYVDYAHTPDALEQALRALRPHVRGRLHVVFGCGGDRDRGKRPEMGRIAAELADTVVVTDDNPRGEDPAAIRDAVLDASPGAREVGDRADAIRVALQGLAADDALLVAGKGHEQGQIVGKDVRPFDDGDQARAAVAELGGEKS